MPQYGRYVKSGRSETWAHRHKILGAASNRQCPARQGIRPPARTRENRLSHAPHPTQNGPSKRGDGQLKWLGWPPKDRPMFLVTTAAFLAVCVYAFFTYQQVTQSQRANNIADRAFFTVNIPYVIWASGEAARIIPPNTSEVTGYGIFNEVKNFGRTPATRVTMQYCDPIVRDNSTQPVFTCSVSQVPQRESNVIGPEQQLAFSGPIIPPQTFTNTYTGATFLYLFGYLLYHDDLLGEETHMTRFCHRVQYVPQYVPSAAQSSPGTSAPQSPILVFFSGCNDPLWNCVDNDCAPIPGLSGWPT